MSGFYYALIGDIVSSRELPDRAAVQRCLRAVLDELNADLGDRLAAPLQLTAGDEVQALLVDAELAADIVERVADALHPASMVWGLGRGGLDTDLEDDVAMLDGPCLHRAREAIEEVAGTGRWLLTAGIDAPHGGVVSGLFNLVWALRSGWTGTQLKYVRVARHENQTEVARQFGVSKQNISKTLDAANFASVREGERALRALLRWMDHASAAELPQP